MFALSRLTTARNTQTDTATPNWRILTDVLLRIVVISIAHTRNTNTFSKIYFYG